MRALIGGWREVWDQGDFPFYYVQLAPFDYTWRSGLVSRLGLDVSPDYWRALASRFGLDVSPYKLPEIWEAQAAALSIRNTGMAVTNDIGNVGDIHPTNKQEVGRRLSLWALAKTYGQPGLMYSGPSYRSMAKRDGAVVLRFDHADGLRTRDGEPPDWCGSTGGVALGLSYDENCTLARTPHIRQAVALIRRGLNKMRADRQRYRRPAASDRRKPPLMSPRMSSQQDCPSANS